MNEKRLTNFEKMYQAVFQEQEKLAVELAKLKSEGKEKTAHFRELLAKRLSNSYVISLYQIYGLTD